MIWVLVYLLGLVVTAAALRPELEKIPKLTTAVILLWPGLLLLAAMLLVIGISVRTSRS